MAANLEGDHEGQGLKIGLVVSRFNDIVTDGLLRAAEECLERHGCTDRTVVRVPGAWELPQAANKLLQGGGYDAVIALGALIRGETPHFDVLAHAVARGLSDAGLAFGVPVIFGVLTTETVEQALDRSGAESGNKGREAALTAIEMVRLFRRMA